MKRIKRYLKLILGSFIIGATLNLFFKSFSLVPNGIFGFGIIYSIKTSMTLATTIILMNIFFLLLGYLTISKSIIKKALIPSFLVPLFILITNNISNIIDISSADLLLIAIFGGVLIGLGNRFIYQENRLVGANDIIEELGKAIVGPNGKIINYIIDTILVFFIIINFGINSALYAIISIFIIELMGKRSTIGISQAKVFYIITKKERAVKKFIMEELHYDITIFDVKGGFSKNKNKVIMSAIQTKDYYKLREGIKKIDPEAFITITDSYEVINDNVAINK